MPHTTPSSRLSRVCDSANFHVESYSPRCDATVIAAECESWKERLQSKWLGAETNTPWSPRCVVVIHARRDTYRAAVGRGAEQSFGSSWIDSKGGRIDGRRIDLLVDSQGAVSALGHELTHVVLADAFPGSQPPAWAGEGAAVLADSIDKQRLHKRDLDQSFKCRAAYSCAELMSMEQYPSPARIAAFYGQSASLTAFLADLDGPEKFVPFLKQARDLGYDRALQKTYGIQGVTDLQGRWYRHHATKGALPQLAAADQALGDFAP